VQSSYTRKVTGSSPVAPTKPNQPSAESGLLRQTKFYDDGKISSIILVMKEKFSLDDVGALKGRPMTKKDREAIKQYIADYKAKKETQSRQKPKKKSVSKNTRSK
jgi:hypothetical protein